MDLTKQTTMRDKLTLDEILYQLKKAYEDREAAEYRIKSWQADLMNWAEINNEKIQQFNFNSKIN